MQNPSHIIQRLRDKFVHSPQSLEIGFDCYKCDTTTISRSVLAKLHHANVRIIDVPDHKPGAVDRRILLDLDRFERVHRPPATIVLISSDIDYVGKLNDLRHQVGYYVVVIHNKPVSEDLWTSINAHYLWDMFTKQPDSTFIALPIPVSQGRNPADEDKYSYATSVVNFCSCRDNERFLYLLHQINYFDDEAIKRIKITTTWLMTTNPEGTCGCDYLTYTHTHTLGNPADEDKYSYATSVVNFCSCRDNERFLYLLHQINYFDDEAIKRIKITTTWLMTTVGLPLIWMGEEWCEDKIRGDEDRTRKINKIDWSLLTKTSQRSLFELYRKLIAFRKSSSAIKSDNVNFLCHDSDTYIVAYHRWYRQTYCINNWPKNGRWQELISQSEIQIDNNEFNIDLKSYVFKIFAFKDYYATSVVNFCSCHDNERFLYLLHQINYFDDEAIKRIKIAIAWLMITVGLPLIWMGEEWCEDKILGDKDPTRKINWSLLTKTSQRSLFELYRKLIAIRKSSLAIKSDNVTFLYQQAYSINNWPKNGRWQELISQSEIQIDNNEFSIDLKSYEFKIFAFKD
ncbi:unnamed protein product [Adineta steineri]|uniref:NYN domain-containing protein n=1 Tax=Adineta steineri TaxID=433720 RepID=A0A814FM21_9BILA|nr:unnamed protein product [Adineta steineri]